MIRFQKSENDPYLGTYTGSVLQEECTAHSQTELRSDLRLHLTILHSWNIQYMYMNYTWTLHERTLIQFCPVSFSIILNPILSFCILFHHFESFSIILDPFPDLDLFPSFWIFFYHFRSFFRFVSFSIILDPFPSF